MRKLCVWIIALTLLLGVPWWVAPASAWEFSMTGNFSWEYKLYSHLGSSGFFGPFNVDISAGGGTTIGDLASMNGWLGNEITGTRLASGADVSASTMYMTLNPEIVINEALRIRGSYYIGSWGITTAAAGGIAAPAGMGLFNIPEYFNSTLPGVQSSFSPGYWNTLWATAQLPWGTFVAGKRPFTFGNGLFLNGEDNTSYEGLLLVAPYGPLRVGLTFFPYLQGIGNPYPAIADKNGIQEFHGGGFVTYDAGPLSVGVLVETARFHQGPESQLSTATRLTYIPRDTTVTDGTAFIKYNNGRFFFNAEAAFVQLTTRRQKNLAGVDTLASGYSDFAPRYIDHQRYMAEMGGMCGPTKVSLLWAWIPGPDRRAGIFIDRSPDTRALTQLTNFSVFRPYSILLAWNYGAGNNSFTASNGIGSDNGYITDANTWGARLDYAVAANLNVYGSFFWADRVSHGYPWGFIAPSLSAPGNIAYQNAQSATDAARPIPTTAPSIPDNNLGWEIDAGFDWQLLEGYTVKLAAGYWRPGKWFSFACADRSNTGWKTPAPGNNFGISPSRKIDAVYGADIVLSVDF